MIRTCLAKDSDDRWQSAGDLAREFKWIAETPAITVITNWASMVQ